MIQSIRRALHHIGYRQPAAEDRQRLMPLTPLTDDQRERIRARILGDLPAERDVVAAADRILGLRA